MKRILLYLCLLLSTHAALAASDTIGTWIDQVRILRDAIYQRDKETTKSFFNFPYNDAEFWYIVGVPNLGEKKAPVTEKSFDLYFDKIFDKKFITAFLKIKTKDLYEKGSSQTAEFTDDHEEFYSMEATYDKAGQTVTLNFNGHNPKVEDGGEYSLIYIFKIAGGKLKFYHLYMAG